MEIASYLIFEGAANISVADHQQPDRKSARRPLETMARLGRAHRITHTMLQQPIAMAIQMSCRSEGREAGRFEGTEPMAGSRLTTGMRHSMRRPGVEIEPEPDVERPSRGEVLDA